MTAVLPVLGACGLAALLAVAVAGCGKSSASGHHHPHSSAHSMPVGSATAAGRPATVVTKFTPYTAGDSLAVPVNSHAAGRCWTGSIAVPVKGAYRCLVGNKIADPCFAPHHPAAPNTVACVNAPWSPAEVVALSGPLPKVTPHGQAAKPWAVQLANGARCVAATGTVQTVGDVSLNLLCSGGTAAGGLDTSGAVWTVNYGTAASGQVTEIAVTAAWTG
jgi:hypothetical protein